jgi:hypothetical protein
MPIPAYPANFLPRPFAANGTFQVIPDAKAAEGRASWQEGFPTETQLPLNQGGVAPSRPDFNGIFNALSALAYWQQTGGLFMYSAAQDYNTPAMVFYDSTLWFCKAPNGPDTTVGVIPPGENTDYWISFLEFLASGGGGGSTSLGVPVGTVILFFGTSAPDGYFACDGSAFDITAYPALHALLNAGTTPDLRGLFIRGYDPTNRVDPSGSARAIGSKQGDAMRNITAIWATDSQYVGGEVSGAVYYLGNIQGHGALNRDDASGGKWGFNASRVVPTAPENRPNNATLLYCIKHD